MPQGTKDGVLLPMYKDKQETGNWARSNNIVWSLFVLSAVVMYGSYGVLVHLSKVGGHLPYSSYSVVFFIEFFKLCISIVLYYREARDKKFELPRIPLSMMAAFAVPSLLYSFNNNIGLHMQLDMDPTTFQVLSNLKIGATAFLYRYIMKRDLSVAKWSAIGLLLLAGVCDSYGGFHEDKGEQMIFITKLGLAMMLTYVMVSGTAAVFTEYIFKMYMQMSLNLQNILMYTSGIFINGAMFVIGNMGKSAALNHGLLDGFSVYTWIIVISQAVNGLMMSIVMKHGTNITRLFIISGAMIFTTLLSIVILGTRINFFFILAAGLVTVAIYLYHK